MILKTAADDCSVDRYFYFFTCFYSQNDFKFYIAVLISISVEKSRPAGA